MMILQMLINKLKVINNNKIKIQLKIEKYY